MKFLLAGLIAILLQLGLAILGWRGFDAFFSHPPLIGLTAATVRRWSSARHHVGP
jgi:hypothetical protein